MHTMFTAVTDCGIKGGGGSYMKCSSNIQRSKHRDTHNELPRDNKPWTRTRSKSPGPVAQYGSAHSSAQRFIISNDSYKSMVVAFIS